MREMTEPTTAEELRKRCAGRPLSAIREACLLSLPEAPDLALVVALWLSGFDSPAGSPRLESEHVEAIARAPDRCLVWRDVARVQPWVQ